MDVRTSSSSSSTRTFYRESPASRSSVRLRSRTRFLLPPVGVASAGDFDTDAKTEATAPSSRAPRTTSEEDSRKKLDVMTGLLKEGYGVGALLTAAAFRGASLTNDIVKSMTQSGTPGVRRHRVVPTRRRRSSQERDPSILERFQQKVSETLTATSITWRQKNERRTRAGAQLSDQNVEKEREENVLACEEAPPPVVAQDSELDEVASLTEGEEEDSSVVEFKATLGIPLDEPLSSRHISEAQLRPAAMLDAAEEGLFVEKVAEETSVSFAGVDVLEDLVKEEEEASHVEETPPVVLENIPVSEVLDVTADVTAGAEALDVTVGEDPGDASSLVAFRAQEILDEIANFEIETGESFDSSDEKRETMAERAKEELPPPPVPQKSKAEIERELKEQMRMESERRLRAMRIGNQPSSHRQEQPVKVERPTTPRPDHTSTPSASSPRPMAPPTEKFKGLDYIKTYAKGTHGGMGETSKESTSPFFTPPSILQDPKKTQRTHATSSAARAYSQWREVDRLKRVREIGTVMWLGRGGNGGSSGNGGSGGGGGHSGGSSDDQNWWMGVGVSMVTMTALVFALLTMLSDQLEKQRRKTASASAK